MAIQDIGVTRLSSDDNEKELYQPFRKVDIDPNAAALQRTTEEKMYLVLYYNIEYEEYKFAKFYGRYNAYFGIRDLLEAESIDLHASEVLVETVGLDARSRQAKRYLMHPEEALDIYDFCKQMEKFFGDNAYSIEAYDTGYTIKEAADIMKNNEPSPITYQEINARLAKGRQEAVADSVSMGQMIMPDSAPQPFMDLTQSSEIGKQFFTSANMGEVESKEI